MPVSQLTFVGKSALAGSWVSQGC